MEVIQTLRQGPLSDVLQALLLALVVGRLVVPEQQTPRLKGTSSPLFNINATVGTGFFIIALASRFWLSLVNKYVPEPYLDEVFHIPQVQTYCEGRFWDWDDKITTPPGLYLISVAYHKLRGFSECTPSSLRSTNLFAVLIAVLAAQCHHLSEVRAAERAGKPPPKTASFDSYYTGLNIAFFPVLFFFSALYYTDVASTMVVLVAYRNHLLRLAPQPPTLGNDLWTMFLGVWALLMRQTNVFWVVVYMGGLEAAHVLRTVEPGSQQYPTKLHDPPLTQSTPEDWVFCLLTLGTTALLNPVKVLRQIWPHISILALFAGFVAWNGGVVLGDKSNHIATIHLAQMLYIWPLFAFFSAPLIVPSALSGIARPMQYLKSLLLLTSKRATLISLPYTLLTILLSLAIVKYNTIIHPFTLADNRHYMFYVFRYTIRRSNAIRLSLVAAYTVCRWLVWDQLARPGDATQQQQPSLQSQPQQQQPPTTTTTTTKPPPNDEPPTATPPLPPSTSTTLLWLLTTTLSLITAPLVEPRYFILPWIFYRLLIPRPTTTPPTPPPPSAPAITRLSAWLSGRWGWGWGPVEDGRLVLETGWFAVVNGVTMYVFLFWGFYWRGEDGAVGDGGRVQRFMW
ncbi:glycosyltransferase family 59 protein [Chaetomium tenue]|uniref:Glycosyltransferase family 59 protein n=1 Tax=Chaetomium tenue TaxID=1854479 RepID=A0ACB7PEA8_9PEZI|nr:glycosyltransferase family 59 protein [Chaetomium globosum]